MPKNDYAGVVLDVEPGKRRIDATPEPDSPFQVLIMGDFSGRASRGLVELAFDGGTLLVSAPAIPIGAPARVRIPAREVILAKRPSEGLSLYNMLAAIVVSVHVEPDDDQAVVQLSVGRTLLLAEVTRDAVDRKSTRLNSSHVALSRMPSSA